MCSAPLDVAQAIGPTVRCNYCGNTVIVPEELRHIPNQIPNVHVGESFVPMLDHALKLAEIARLVKAGNKIAAIKLHRETFGTGLKEAKDAVEQMETGQPIVFTETNFQGAQAAAQSFPQGFQSTPLITEQTIKKTKRLAGLGLLLVILLPLSAGVIGIIIAIRAISNIHIHAMPTPSSSSGRSGSTTSSYANSVLEFGSEGIGPKQFKDARSVAVDGQGHIYVAEYTGGRIQVFDGNGNFQTQWMVDPKKVVMNIAADRKGTVYVVHPGSILRYDGATGNLLGEVAKNNQNRSEFYSDAFVALDGSLYAIGSNSNIIHIGADGQIKNTIKVADKVADNVDFDKVAVDGTGNIYALEGRENNVYKFAPDGRYINRFGGKGREPGQLDTPFNLAVDGQGRVYISTAGRGIEVFDSNGRYIDSFGSVAGGVIFGLVVTDQNEIIATDRNKHQIIKFALKK
ncbi:MAG TPA: hypothetical protein VF779_15820 [Pyrinomonadaceae bacterium]